MEFVNYSVFYKDLKTRGLEYAARHSRDLGLGAVEFLVILPLDEASVCNRYTAKEVKRILDENGLRVSCFSACVDLFWGDVEAATAQMLRLVDFAADIGSPKIHHTLVPGLDFGKTVVPYESVLAAVLPYAVQIADAAAARGMACLYEPQGCYFNGVAGLRGFYDEIKRHSSNVGICGDVGNGLFVDASAREIYDAFLTDIRHVHVKDYRVTDSPDPQKRSYVSRAGRYLTDCPIGEGVTDFRYCFEKLKRAGYDGDVSLELLGDDREILQTVYFLKNMIREVWNHEI